MEAEFIDFYQMVGVSRNATQEKIDAKFIALALLYNPAHNGGNYSFTA